MKTILIIDDIEDNITLLSFDLEDAGYNVISALSAKEGLVKAAEEKPDCILLDYQMPEMNGIECCRVIKADKELCNIPVIMISANDNEELIIEGLDAGALDYISKPFTVEIVCARIRTAIRIQEYDAALISAKQEAESASKARSMFLANMSHEIRTPLNGILGITQLMNESEMSVTQQDYLETISSSGEMLLDLVNDILDFAKIESGNIDLENIPTDIRKIIEDTLSLFIGKANEKRVLLSGIIDNTVPSSITCDPTRLKQVLSNLVSNAIKFTEDGQCTVHAEDISTEDGQHVLRISVNDSGIGMNREQRERIFKPFIQADSSITRTHGGTGLGLAICKQITEALNGNMKVESNPGFGSTFIIEFPYNADKSGTAVNKEGDRIAIICDNHEDSRKSLARKLSEFGITAMDAMDVTSARTLIEHSEADFIFIDLDMVDFISILDVISRPEDIIFTGNADLRQRLSEIGLQDEVRFLAKPFRKQQLQRYVGDESPSGLLPSIQDLLSGSRILVAEDNLVNQKVINKMLQNFGCIVTITNNGLEAVESAQEHHYDAVLLDCQMPILDGISAAKKIRDLPNYKNIPIIALTGNTLEQDKARALEAGMNIYLTKPINKEILEASLLEQLV